MENFIAVKTIAETGEQINVTKIHKGMGKYQGDVCDLIEYKKEGVKHLIYSPLLAK